MLPIGLARLLKEVDDRVDGARRARLCREAIERSLGAFDRMPDGTVFVVTGDIPAMWLRDSTAQCRPLLAAARDAQIAELLIGVSRRQASFVIADPRANAFMRDAANASPHRDFRDQNPLVWERKYEVDSHASVLDLAHRIWKVTGATEHLDPTFHEAARAIVDLVAAEQDHDSSDYRFVRRMMRGLLRHPDSLPRGGRGTRTSWTGMTWSGFRPSDDPCRYGFHVPGNAYMCVALAGLADIAEEVLRDRALASAARHLRTDIETGIRSFGHADTAEGTVLAYEVDGLGNQLLMDDANCPSLLSLPYVGWCAADDPLYLRTRSRCLSTDNPHFQMGSAATGIGSPHTPRRHVWPLSLALQGLTSTDPDEVELLLAMLEGTDAGTDRMHESFHADDPFRFTREWFAWADMTYVHLVLRSVGLSADAD